MTDELLTWLSLHLGYLLTIIVPPMAVLGLLGAVVCGVRWGWSKFRKESV